MSDPRFNLGVSISPFWGSNGAVENAFELARAASEARLSSFVVGAKSGSDSGIRSGSAITTRLIPELAGVDRIGCLFLVREYHMDSLVAEMRTVNDLVGQVGSVAILGLMQGRRPGLPSRAPANIADAVSLVRGDAAFGSGEVWIAAERGKALTRAARFADVWLANAYYDIDRLREQLTVFTQRDVRRAVRRDFVCEADSGSARHQRSELLDAGYRGERFSQSSMIAGSPDECIESLSRVAALGFDEVLIRPAVGGRAGVAQLRLLLEQWDLGVTSD